jgi:iron-sulfur cluster repair protein YtfE (RIC family)
MTMMHTMHDALRREAEHIARITAQGASDDPRRVLAAAAGWRMFESYLHTHHTAEDQAIWPVLRAELADRPDDLALLDAMESEHAAIDPLLAAIDAETGNAHAGPQRLAELVDQLVTTLTGHLKHEETEALPLIDATMSAVQWQQFSEVHRNGIGADTPRYFPWLLDHADDARIEQVFSVLPASVRQTYLTQWQPAYVQLDPWGSH